MKSTRATVVVAESTDSWRWSTPAVDQATAASAM
jgi:hypothetical protein